VNVKTNLERIRQTLRAQWKARTELEKRDWELTANNKTAPKELVKKVADGIIQHWIKALKELKEKANLQK
jgi:hypothetical protein